MAEGLKYIVVPVGVAAGFAAGYFFAKKKLELKYMKIADDEIAEMRKMFKEDAFYRRTHPEKPKLEALIDELGYDSSETTKPEIGDDELPFETDLAPLVVEGVVPTPDKNVFTAHNGDVPPESQINGRVWDYAEEVKSRSDDRPYIIHRDEYFGEEIDYDQTTLTYFVGDDVLADAKDQIEPDIDGTVGIENLENFGHGSGDANILYIRNDRLNLEMEVVRSGGTYAMEVHGLEADGELEHSAMPRRGMRFDDD